ncbi:MAG TPA: exodeoxyribonuclease VII large subunit, partial [Eggerthellaceae bacterium]|nr:exodeoxyribonuclease VII large subunit [Eggerthellaceae bacterium]
MGYEQQAANAVGAPNALSVSAAMQMAKRSLEAVVVRILGEVSEVSVKPGYKAAYFTIKDSGAALPCMMWNNR